MVDSESFGVVAGTYGVVAGTYGAADSVTDSSVGQNLTVVA